MKALPINENHHSREELEHLARQCNGNEQHKARRIRGILMAMSGLSHKEAARSQGVGAQTLRDWVLAYNKDGVEGLCPRPRGGSQSRLSPENMQELVDRVEAGPAEGFVSPSRYRISDIKALIKTLFEIRYSWEGTCQLLHRLGLRWISPRPLHPKTDPEAQEAFRKDFKSLVREAVGPDVKGRIEIWFQDEARMGQQGILRRIWAPRGGTKTSAWRLSLQVLCLVLGSLSRVPSGSHASLYEIERHGDESTSCSHQCCRQEGPSWRGCSGPGNMAQIKGTGHPLQSFSPSSPSLFPGTQPHGKCLQLPEIHVPCQPGV